MAWGRAESSCKPRPEPRSTRVTGAVEPTPPEREPGRGQEATHPMDGTRMSVTKKVKNVANGGRLSLDKGRLNGDPF